MAGRRCTLRTLLTIGGVACALLGCATDLRAQGLTASSSVNGSGNKLITNVPPSGATGVSVAAGKVFNPAMEDYRVSRAPGDGNDGNAAANNDERPILQSLINAAKIYGGQKNQEARTDAMKRFDDDLKVGIVQNKNPDRFVQVDKSKSQTLLARIVPQLNPDAQEEARASASQMIQDKQVKLPVSTSTLVEAKMAPAPMAVALAVNRDPLAIDWSSDPSHRNITVDLSDLSLTAKTTGAPSIAVASFAVDASFVDGTLDLGVSEDSASRLFAMSVSIASIDGGSASLDSLLLDNFGNAITDSRGDMGIDQVRQGLMAAFTQIDDGVFGFSSPYSFTVSLPGSGNDSVLFARDSSVASAQLVPEPTSLVLFGLGALGVLGYTRRRRGRAPVG